MLFNSYIFILLFLPAVLIGFQLISIHGGNQLPALWLLVCSLVFYGWFRAEYVPLIALSIVFNFGIGEWLTRATEKRLRVALVSFGVAANLLTIGYFKYAGFFVINVVGLAEPGAISIILPIAISFFTFQQIAYLVDAYRREVRERSFLHYSLFVVFFPQLIAGPIVHHKEMMPQLMSRLGRGLSAKNLALGASIFSIGLFKKVIIADTIALYATPVFTLADGGLQLNLFEAWSGALAYTFQLYFDFSGYSEMALGLAAMFGVRLPLNFFSPYKANSIIDFWSRWHMTLSRFLRDYLYIPLGGNRRGPSRRYTNLLVTMLLGGLWHGAGWGFVLWGSIHGILLVINHGWRRLRGTRLRAKNRLIGILAVSGSRLLTFFVVVVAWVPFRAETLGGTLEMWRAMFGQSKISLPHVLDAPFHSLSLDVIFGGVTFEGFWLNGGSGDNGVILLYALLLFIVWALPATPQIMGPRLSQLATDPPYVSDKVATRVIWEPRILWVVFIGLLAVTAFAGLGRTSEFLYFQF